MKLGLALSGGGFRASFFHIGVLARMAEIGKLRQVEVISTVSGGSIIGAMYYVKLKKIFDNNASPTNEQLVNLVKEMEVEFLEGVQQNIRMRAFVNPLKNLRMCMANYSRSDRMAELYDELFYHPVLNPDGNEMIKMRDLKISPDGKAVDSDEFNQSHESIVLKLPIINRLFGTSTCKLPIILINATSLNSGHNWRFEASRMGEPARDSKNILMIDTNSRFSRPAKYDDMPEKPANTKLGHAVAASACVPGLFNPLAVSDLYDDIQVQLVDGGVHDNQGVEALLEKYCDEIIVSDASKYMSDEMGPSTQIPRVLGRSSNILMDRVREEELKNVLNNNGVKSTILHLRKGLPARMVPYINEANPNKSVADWSLDFGVHPDVQDALSNIRTDLDSFSDIEADALMADGYLMSKHSFEEKLMLVDNKHGWNFSYLINEMRNNSNHDFMKHLKVANKQFLKVFFLKPVTSTLIALLFTLAISVIICLTLGDDIQSFLNEPLESKTNKDLFIYIGSIIIFVTLSIILSRWEKLHALYKFIRHPIIFIGRFLIRALPPILASIFIYIHLKVFDKIFLAAGNRKNFRSSQI